MIILAEDSAVATSSVILSFDIEATYHIYVARGCRLSPSDYVELTKRLAHQVQWLRSILSRYGVRATFFWVGELAKRLPYLVRALKRDGHEIACHGWAHRSLRSMEPEEAYQDIEQNKAVLEDIIGEQVWGFRAPSFSIVRQTGWAISVLAQLGFSYDSSIYPVLHDRYGVRKAPRTPFVVRYKESELLELPPATWQVGPMRLAVGGGGHFRFWPETICRAGIRQLLNQGSYVTLYFHPWEFDTAQPRLPLRWLDHWRTYTGIAAMPAKLERLLQENKFILAKEAAKQLDCRRDILPRLQLCGITG